MVQILSTPGFPASLVHPPPAHRIGTAPGKGLGIFATRDLDMGDTVHVERPLLVLPSYLGNIKIGCPKDWPQETVMQAAMFEREKEFRRAFERLEPDAQTAYLALANIHTEDGSGPIRGISRTNGFGIEGLNDIIDTYEAPYVGICRYFSRTNHRYFDQKTFAFCFCATRPIKNGEKLTIGYGHSEDVRSVHQEILQKYEIDCDCPACGPDFEMSDQNRVDIMASVEDLVPNFKAWLKDKALPEDELIKTSRWWIRVIESEGLESTRFYREHLEAIYNSYIALGDRENAIKYGPLWGKSLKADGQLDPPVESYSDPCVFQSNSNWAIRKA